MNKEQEHPFQNKQAEKAIIGSCLLKPTHIETCLNAGCESSWFTDSRASTTFDIMKEMSMKDLPVNQLTVSDYAMSSKKLEEISLFMDECIDITPTAVYIGYYLQIIKDKYNRRELRSLFGTSLEMLDSNTEVDKVTASLEYEISKLHLENGNQQTFLETISSCIKEFKNAQETGFLSLPSRWVPLQRKTGGYRKGKVTIIAARPGMGKTTFACNEAVVMASVKSGYSVGFISLEMTDKELIKKMICDQAELNLFKLDSGDAEEDEIDRFKKEARILNASKLYVIDKSMDIVHIRNWIRKMKIEKKLDIVFIDYVQLINSTPGVKITRVEQVSYFSKELARIAKDMDVAIVALAQISRGGEPPQNAKPEERWKFTPKLYHLKESGALEEDAYCVILLYPHPVQTEITNLSYLDIVPYIAEVAKNRMGPLGKTELVFAKSAQRFTDRGYTMV